MTAYRLVLVLMLVGGRATCLAQGNTVQAQQQDLQSQTLVAKAIQQMDELNNDAALGTLQEALELNPQNVTAHFWIGFIARQRAVEPQMKELAARHLRAALELHPDGELGQTARSWLMRVTGRPVGFRLVLDNTGVPASQQDRLRASTAIGDMMVSKSNSSTKTEADAPADSRRADTRNMSAMWNEPFSIAMMQQSDLEKRAREWTNWDAAAGPRFGWVGALGGISTLLVGSGNLQVAVGHYASMPLTVVDPIDGRIVLASEVNNASALFALTAGLLDMLKKEVPLLRSLSGPVEGALLVNALASRANRRLERVSNLYREREFHDETALPLKQKTGRVWLRALGRNEKAKDDTTQPAGRAYLTPGEILAQPRLAIAPVFCDDVLGQEVVDDLAEDIVSEVVAQGNYAVLPASQVRQAAVGLRAGAPEKPLLRCYEQVTEAAGARYLLLTWMDDFELDVEGKSIVGAQATARMTGRWALRDLAEGTTVRSARFAFARKRSDGFGDGGERLLVVTDEVSGQVRQAIVQALVGATSGQEGAGSGA